MKTRRLPAHEVENLDLYLSLISAFFTGGILKEICLPETGILYFE